MGCCNKNRAMSYQEYQQKKKPCWKCRLLRWIVALAVAFFAIGYFEYDLFTKAIPAEMEAHHGSADSALQGEDSAGTSGTNEPDDAPVNQREGK